MKKVNEDKNRGGVAVLSPRPAQRRKCRCNDRDPLVCHECEESTGVCYCVCHAGFKRGR